MLDEHGAVSVFFDSSIYSLTAVKKAAYKFAKICSVHLQPSENGITATLNTIDTSLSDTDKVTIAGALCNEAIDQDLRESISAKTEGVRNLILAQAFSKTSLLEQT